MKTVDNAPAQPAMNNIHGPVSWWYGSCRRGKGKVVVSFFFLHYDGVQCQVVNDDGRKGKCRKGKMGEGISNLRQSTTKSMNTHTSGPSRTASRVVCVDYFFPSDNAMLNGKKIIGRIYICLLTGISCSLNFTSVIRGPGMKELSRRLKFKV